jgi:hypothetical protein
LRVAQARSACLAQHDPAHCDCRRAYTGAEAFGTELAAVPAPTGREHACV